jgi:hypothetical protein
MTTLAAKEQLWVSLHDLRDHTTRLKHAVGDVELAPGEAMPWLVSTLHDHTVEVCGIVEESVDAIARIGNGREAMLAGVRAASDGVERVREVVYREIATPECMRDVRELGRERRGKWMEWAQNVRDCVQSTLLSLNEATTSVVGVLSELAELSVPTG